MNIKRKATGKILSLFLAVTLLLGMIPVGVSASSETHPDVFTVTVTDEKGEKVEDVSVTITPIEDIGIPIFSEVTGSDGVAEFQEITDHFSDEGVEFHATYEATKEGYDRTVCNENVTISESDGNLDITIITTEAPEITDVTGNPDEWVKEATLTVAATDNDDPENLKYRVNGGVEQGDPNFLITENGTYKFEAIDKGGNVSEIWEVVVEKIDNIAPQNISVVVNPESWTKDDITVTVSADDNESGLDDEPYSIDNEDWQSEPEFTVKTNGEYTFYVKDRVGNIALSEPKQITNKDTERPAIDSITIKYNGTQIDENTYISTKEAYTFTLSASDIGSGVAAFSIDGADWKEVAEGESSYTFSLQGAEEYTFYVKDAVGNEGEKVLKMNIDENAPIVTVEPSTTAPTDQISYTVKAEEPAEESGLNALAYKLDGNDWTSVNEFEITDRNKHTIYVQDNAVPANIYSTTFRATNLNLSNPAITEIKLSPPNWTNETVKFEVISEIVEYQDDDGTYSFPIVDYEVDGVWQKFTDENITNIFEFNDCKEHTFRVKDTSGKCSDYFTIAATNYDAKVPELADSDENNAVTFEQKNDGTFARLLNKLTFGRFFNKTLAVTVTAIDEADDNSNVSGIDKAVFTFIGTNSTEYSFEPNEDKKIGNKDTHLINFEIPIDSLPVNFKGTASVTLSDVAGNVIAYPVTTENSNMGKLAEGKEDYNFMIENDAPVISDLAPESETIFKEKIEFSLNVNDVTEEEYSGIATVKFTANKFDANDVTFIEDIINANEQINYREYDVTVDPAKKVLTISSETGEVGTIDLNDNWNNGKIDIIVESYDNAGNVAEAKSATYYFDQTAPVIDGFDFSVKDNIDTEAEGGLYIPKPIEVTNYGFFFKENVVVTIFASDYQNELEAIASGVKSITYKAVDINGEYVDGYVYSAEDVPVNINDEGKSYISFELPANFKGQIFAYATDNVDNSPVPDDCVYYPENIDAEGFVHPDGSIVENTDRHIEESSIAFTVPKMVGVENSTFKYEYDLDENAIADSVMDYNIAQRVPLYNTNPTFGVNVTDKYSGIRNIKCTVIEGGEARIADEITVPNETNETEIGGWNIDGTDGNLITSMSKNITIDGNYNDMVLLVELTDRAGNKSYDYYVFGIDKTAPSITVTYDNNSSDTQSGTGDYFKANRTATVVVKERNFNTENVKFTIENAEGQAPKVVDKGQTKADKIGNGDENEYTYTITYNEDGVYSFAVAYTDRAINKASVDTKNSVAPYEFILDKTMPTISVSYDNNEAQNEKYFKANRTATITIVEHNFDVNRVIITQTSALSGNSIANPSVSWVNNGDTHTGTIRYNTDGDYTFDITMTDRAGNKETGVNYGNSVAAKDFTVDTTYSDIVKVDGIANQGVLGLNDGNIDPDATITITINDVNLDDYNITLTRSRVLVTGESDNKYDAEQENVKDNPEKQCKEDNDDVTSQFVSNASGNSNATAKISIPKRDKEGVKNDGIYTLTIEAKDKAGNAYDTNSNIITFSVNRFGSVFTFSNDLYNLITNNDGYTQKVASSDLTVYEYNATPLKSESVEVISNNDSNILESGVDYTVSEDTRQTDTSWCKYTYNVKSDNFADDGTYTLRISSEDAASITSQTVDYDVCSATFRVDSTPADIISVNYSTEVNKIAGRDGASARAEDLEISFTVEDLIRLEKIEVFVNDMKNPKFTYQYGKDFDSFNTFEPEPIVLERSSDEQSFKIVVTDKAGNVIDTSEGDSNGDAFEPGYVFFDHITVTTNLLAIWAKSPVFWGVVGGVAVAAVGIAILIVLKKHKKDDETHPNE